jgi:hypothetical protein
MSEKQPFFYKETKNGNRVSLETPSVLASSIVDLVKPIGKRNINNNF